MQKLMVRTDQLLCIAKAPGSKIDIRDSEANTHGKVRTLVLFLKQYHSHCYWFYEKEMTRAMISFRDYIQVKPYNTAMCLQVRD